jgi:hypothetical protein
MRDIIYILYMFIWVLLVRVANRTPIWQPRTYQMGAVTYLPDQRPMGCMMILFLAIGAMVGVTLPMVISDILPAPILRVYPDQGLDALGRLAQIVGGLSGAYVGLRGSWLWCLLFLLGMGLYVLHAVVAYVLGGL